MAKESGRPRIPLSTTGGEQLKPGVYRNTQVSGDYYVVKKEDPNNVYDLDGNKYQNPVRSVARMKEKDITEVLDYCGRVILLLGGTVPPVVERKD